MTADGLVVGRVVELRRYPVKSLRGQVLARAEVGDTGVVGDRAAGIVDTGTGRLLSAKTVPALLQATAVLREDGGISISLPTREPGVAEGTSTDEPDVDDVLSQWLERRVSLRRPVPGERADIDIDIDLTDRGGPAEARFTFQSRAGSFADGGPVHLLTTASLRAMAACHPSELWTADRFRPNIVVDVEGDAFAEDDWVGHELRVGGVDLRIEKRCDRCILVTRPTADAPGDGALLKALHRHHGGDLGVKASITGIGVVRVGDEVTLLR